MEVLDAEVLATLHDDVCRPAVVEGGIGAAVYLDQAGASEQLADPASYLRGATRRFTKPGSGALCRPRGDTGVITVPWRAALHYNQRSRCIGPHDPVRGNEARPI